MAGDYEAKMGTWVAARCDKRRVDVEKMPQSIKDWLDTTADPDEPATTAVRTWLVDTIDDPDWPT